MVHHFTAVQSFWTVPGNSTTDATFMRMWALSAHLLALRFRHLRLVTDEPGAEIAHSLGLPYTSITTELSTLPAGMSRIWASGKLKAYSIMDAPFIHFDQDALVRDALPARITDAAFDGVVAERVEGNIGALEFLDRMRSSIPLIWMAAIHLRRHDDYNAGLLGGNDVAGLRAFSKLALRIASEWVENGAAALEDGGIMSRFLEQWTFAASWAPERIRCLSEHGGPVPGYQHLQGSAKRQPWAVRRIRRELSHRWPAVEARIVGLSDVP